nr:hypothetical protein BHI3_13760 [Bacteriovorax sp. HI3]
MKKLFFLFFLLTANHVFAKGGDEVRNGGGLAENYLTFALKNLGQSIDLCLAQSTCAKKEGERELLLKIKNSLPEEISKKVLNFASEAEKPGFFIINGYVRLAVTGDYVGSPIYYNLDLLYRKGEVFMNYGQAIQTLIHELGHHHGNVDHDQLEILGAEVRGVNEGNVSDVSFLPYLNGTGFSGVAIEAKSYKTNGLLALVFQEEMIDVTPHFTYLRSDCDPDLTGMRPVENSAIQFFNLHWIHNKENFMNGEKVLDGNVVLYCSHGITREYKKFYSFKIGVKARFGNYFLYQGLRFVETPKLLYRLKTSSPMPQ